MRQINYSLYLHTFLILGILFIPFTFFLSPFETSIGQALFGNVINFIWRSYFDQTIVIPITSDSVGMYALLIIIILTTTILFFLLSKFTKASFQSNFIKLIRVVSTIYLSLILFKYGCDKIFQAQFHTPEPNILYTNFGKLDQDILYWSVMGLSWKYSLFLGAIEIFVSIGLLFRKTRVLSMFLGLFTIINIVAINFSFDISVKLLSSFLLILNIVLIFPFLKRTYSFMGGKAVNKLEVYTILPESINSRAKVILMVSIPFLVLSEGLAPHVSNYNLNRSGIQFSIHGAFSTINNHKNSKKLRVKRIYFHKDSYMIFHFENDSQIDFHYEFSKEKNSLVLFDYERNAFRIELIEYKSSQLKLNLKGLFGIRELSLTPLDYEKLPALQENFHWSIENVGI